MSKFHIIKNNLTRVATTSFYQILREETIRRVETHNLRLLSWKATLETKDHVIAGNKDPAKLV